MQKKLFMSIVILAAATLVHAEPENKPSPDNTNNANTERGPDRRMFGEGFGPRSGRFPRVQQPEPTEDEWADVAVFMKEHSPSRWRMYQTAPEGHQGRLRGPIYSAWKTLTRLEREDPEMYELRLKRLPVEDDIFSLAGEIKRSSEKEPELRLKLREKIAAFMESRMQERKLRIKRLETALQEERKMLSESESNRESMIDQRTREVAAQGPGALRENSERPNDKSRRDVVSEEADKAPRAR